jgi:PAS domain S-box-containing protein
VLWLIAGAAASGLGTWSMHYTGMLAFTLPVPVVYHWPTVLISLLVGILGSGVALIIMSRRALGSFQALGASVVMGSAGISALHYTAMASMRFQGMHYYSSLIVALSIMFAIAFSFAAFTLTFRLRTGWNRHWGALCLGFANPAMHYTAMAGTSFLQSNMPVDRSHSVSIVSIGIVSISIVPLMVLIVALLTSTIDRLQTQRALLDSLFEQAPEAVVLLDADHRIVRVNRGFTRLFGYTREEVQGERVSDLVVPDEFKDEYQSYSDLAASGQRVDVEGIRLRKEGSLVHVSILQVAVRLPGRDVAFYAIYRDITERKLAEGRLREYEKAVEGVDQMIVVLDREYRFVVANEALLSYSGSSREELIGHRFTDILKPGVLESLLKEKVDQAFTGNVVHYEMTYTDPTRGTRDLFISYFPIEGPAGIDRVVGIMKDITEAKQAEQKLKATTTQLRALSARLQSAKEEEATRISRELHDELGSVLTSLKWDLETLHGVNSELEDQSQLQVLREKIQAMLRVAEDAIAAVRRISSELRPSILDDLGLVEAMEWQAREFEARAGIAIHYECFVDQVGLSQQQATAIFRIFQEALTNILRHAQATRVDITIKEEAGELILTVKDNGRGITEDDNSISKSLGLLGMQERAHLVGGEIHINGVEGQGTVVILRVPIIK